MKQLELVHEYLMSEKFTPVFAPSDKAEMQNLLDSLKDSEDVKGRMMSIPRLLTFSGYLVGKYTNFKEEAKNLQDRVFAENFQSLKRKSAFMKGGKPATDKEVEQLIMLQEDYQASENRVTLIAGLVEVLEAVLGGVKSLQYTLQEFSKTEREFYKGDKFGD